MQIAIFCLMVRIMGLFNDREEIEKRVALFFICSVLCSLSSCLRQAILKTQLSELLLSTEVCQGDKVQMLYQEMLESLEEAIVVIKGNKIEFKNPLLTSMIERVKGTAGKSTGCCGGPNVPLTSDEILNLKFM